MMMKQLKKAPIQLVQSRSLLAGAIALCSLFSWSQSAIAEGSKELVQNGGHRPYTEWRTNSTAGLLRRTVLKVYANAGEVINLGSSAVGVASGDIVLFNGTDNVSTATPQLKCSTAQPGKGILNIRVQEIAGPLPASGGYTPCTYTAPTSGLYQVAFYGPDGSTGSLDPSTATSSDGPTSINTPLIDGRQNSTVAMWDITVRSNAASTANLNGRVFTDYIALILNANDRYLKSKVYVLTDDGYQYSTDLGIGRGLDPYGFLFFANEKGLLAPNGQPLYHTGLKAGDNSMTPPLNGGVTLQPPTYPLFFNLPSTVAIMGLGTPLTAQAPAAASNFQFTGGAGGSGNQTPKNVGGTFSFSAPQSGSYQIIIDTNNDGVYNPVTGDLALEGSANAGFNTVTWDGNNGDGSVLLPRTGNAPYNTRIILRGGEYHFPLIDAESGADGFKIQMLNPPGAFSNGANTTTVYFDERDYKVGATSITLGCSAAAGLPVCDGRNGVDSASGAHKYGAHTGNQGDYGDKKALDTWIYYPSGIVLAPLVITTTNKANVQAKKSVKFLTDTNGDGKVTVGDRVEYTITYSNPTPAATSDATNFIISETLPSQLTFVSAAIASQTAGNTIALTPGYAGSGALTSTNTLRKGDTIIIKVVATINSANSGNPIKNQASASFTTPDSPATTGTTITDADSAGATANPPLVNNPFFQTDDTENLGNDPTSTADDDPTLITVISLPPNLRLVKRVTAIATTPITGFNDVLTGPNAADDNAPGWITSPPYLQGAFDIAQIPPANQPKPNDEVEYTIYFLSDGSANAQNVALCDFVPNNSTYVLNSLKLSIGAGAPTAISDATGGADTDGGFYSNLSTFPIACSTGTNKGNGAVVVNVGTVDRSTGSGTPTTSYGFIRFRAKVD